MCENLEKPAKNFFNRKKNPSSTFKKWGFFCLNSAKVIGVFFSPKILSDEALVI